MLSPQAERLLYLKPSCLMSVLINVIASKFGLDSVVNFSKLGPGLLPQQNVSLFNPREEGRCGLLVRFDLDL